MLENFPSLNEWASLRDKVLEKSLETGCRVVVKISEKTMKFLELAEQRFPQVKEFVSPWMERWRAQLEEAPCCEEARPFETPNPLPETEKAEDLPDVSVPVKEPSDDGREEGRSAENPNPVEENVASEPPRFAAASLAEQLRELPEDFLKSAFSQNQLLKVLYLMAVSGKEWLLAQEIAQIGDELDFPILPQNIRKVIQLKAVDAGLVRVREREDSRRGAKEFHLMPKGKAFLKSEFHLG